ncbi:MAG: hypothetical protein ACFFE2_09245 [Candidatus Thorarchaeota archaeon]
MSKKTKLAADEVLNKAKAFFDGSFGLTLKNYNPSCCIEFSGEIGFVEITVECTGEITEVIVRTREWEYQIKDFLRSFK